MQSGLDVVRPRPRPAPEINQIFPISLGGLGSSSLPVLQSRASAGASSENASLFGLTPRTAEDRTVASVLVLLWYWYRMPQVLVGSG